MLTGSVNLKFSAKSRGLTLLVLCVVAGCSDGTLEKKQQSSSVGTASQQPPESSLQKQHPSVELGTSTGLIKFESHKPSSEGDPVRANLSVQYSESASGNTFDLTVVLNVDSGYEIHSLNATPPKIPTQLELVLPDGFSALDSWQSPEPVRSLNPGGELVYQGEIRFFRKIEFASDIKPGDYLLACNISYQACNSRRCLRPVTVPLSVKISLPR